MFSVGNAAVSIVEEASWAAQLWSLSIGPGDAAFRLGAALFCGFVLGVDREWRQRPAGLRTHMLVSLASAVFTIIAFEIFERVRGLEPDATADPLRLLEAITAGVAFLAAGTIIRRSGEIEGLTTGAGLWLSGAIGMACGQGLYGLATVAAVLAFAVLTILRRVEGWLHRSR